MDRGGQGRWVASAGHEEVLRLTDLKEVFEDEGSQEEDEGDDKKEVDVTEDADDESDTDAEQNSEAEVPNAPEAAARDDGASADGESDAEWGGAKNRKRKRNNEKDSLIGREKKGRNEIDAEASFFAEL